MARPSPTRGMRSVRPSVRCTELHVSVVRFKLQPPPRKLGPHVASLGMKFYTSSMFPPEYHNQIFIAEHGSSDRSWEAGHTGYRLTVVRVDGDRAGEYETFADGWLGSDNESWGVPPTWSSCPMAHRLFPTTRPTRSTASPTTADGRFSWYRRNRGRSSGEVAERLKAAVLKTVERESVPWVRIPAPPPYSFPAISYISRNIQKNQ